MKQKKELDEEESEIFLINLFGIERVSLVVKSDLVRNENMYVNIYALFFPSFLSVKEHKILYFPVHEI